MNILYITQLAGLQIFFVSASTVNQIRCDPNASMQGGCYLVDYSGEWITTNCSTGYILTSSLTCVPTCNAGYYLNGAQCTACSENCHSCFGPNSFQCLACNPSHAFNHQSICSLTCTNPNQFGLAHSLQCQNCHSSCGSCLQSDQTTCLSCSSSSAFLKIFSYSAGLTDSGYCIANPSTAFPNFFRQYPGDALVVQCPTGCSKCVDRFKCTECVPGYALYPPAAAGSAYAKCYSTS